MHTNRKAIICAAEYLQGKKLESTTNRCHLGSKVISKTVVTGDRFTREMVILHDCYIILFARRENPLGRLGTLHNEMSEWKGNGGTVRSCFHLEMKGEHDMSQVLPDCFTQV